MNVINNTILIIDSENFKTYNLKIILQAYGYKVKIVQNENQAICYLKSNIVHVLISDYCKDKINSTKLIKEALIINPSLAIIIISNYLDVKDAISLIKSGAFDCFNNTFTMEELLASILKAMEKKILIEEDNSSKYKFQESNNYDGIVYESEKMKEIVSIIDRIAKSNATVLLLGESGVGKEIIAKMIHNKSTRKDNRFVVRIICVVKITFKYMLNNCSWIHKNRLIFMNFFIFI